MWGVGAKQPAGRLPGKQRGAGKAGVKCRRDGVGTEEEEVKNVIAAKVPGGVRRRKIKCSGGKGDGKKRVSGRAGCV